MDQKPNKFVEAVLKQLNKSDADKQLESVVNFVETAKIEADTQLALLKTSVLPTAELKFRKAEQAKAKAEASVESARFSIAGSYEAYVSARNTAEAASDRASADVISAQKEIDNAKKQIAKTEAIIADLS